MRKFLFVPAGLILAAALVGGVLLSARSASPLVPSPQASAPLPEPGSGGSVAADPAPTPAAAPETPASAQLAAAPATDDLPTIDVPSRPVNVVPDHDTPPPHPVTIVGRDGRDMTPRSDGAQLASRRAPPPPAPAPAPTPAVTIRGSARLGEALTLSVQGRAVSLFGVQPPQPGERCSVGAQTAARTCVELAREALAARLKNNAAVSCRVPPGQRDGAAAICLDSTGVDLGGFLVAEGFALADRAQSYDYVGAEGVARSFRRGLWRFH